MPTLAYTWVVYDDKLRSEKMESSAVPPLQCYDKELYALNAAVRSFVVLCMLRRTKHGTEHWTGDALSTEVARAAIGYTVVEDDLSRYHWQRSFSAIAGIIEKRSIVPQTCILSWAGSVNGSISLSNNMISAWLIDNVRHSGRHTRCTSILCSRGSGINIPSCSIFALAITCDNQHARLWASCSLALAVHVLLYFLITLFLITLQRLLLTLHDCSLGIVQLYNCVIASCVLSAYL